jgi:hypothetical protein
MNYGKVLNAECNNYSGGPCVTAAPGRQILNPNDNTSTKFYWNNENYAYVANYVNDKGCYNILWEKGTIDYISKKLSELLRGVDPDGKRIVITDNVIANVISTQYRGLVPQVGDIYSRYQVNGQQELNRNDVQEIIDRTIQVIYDYVKNEIEMQVNNSKLTIWTTILGDFNKEGLRQFTTIKTRKRKPDPMLFNMNY